MANPQNDPRFQKVFSDPKYRYARKRSEKVQVDNRFSRDDLVINKSVSKVDKYGRKLKNNDSELTKTFDQLYKEGQEQDEDDEDEDEDEEEESDGDSEEEEDAQKSEDDDEDNESSSDSDGAVEDALAKARGLVDDDDSSSSSSDDDSDEEVDYSVNGDDFAQEEDIPEHDPTTRFAVVNLDWDHLNSNDLFATFSSFLPKSGSIKSVQIFKSEYGKEKLAQEDMNGPPTAIFNTNDKNKEDSGLDSESDSDSDEELDIEAASKKLYKESTEENVEFNTSELRKYQMDRLRYYYAVVTFNSIDTCKHVYTSCDSTEYESTGNFLDLRYVPEEMEFEENDLRDESTGVPVGYKPIDFSTDALRSSKPKLTWDETPQERIQFINRAFKQSELEDMDFKAYLASDSESEEEVEDSTVNKYKSLVKGLVKSNNNGKKAKEAADNSEDEELEVGESDSDVDVEFTFNPDGSAGSSVPKAPEDETPIEKLERKEKERKKARRAKIKELKEKARSKKQAKRASRKNGGDDEDAEPLVIHGDVDAGAEPDHFSQKDLDKLKKLEAKKHKSAKQKRQEAELKERVGQNTAKVEIDDRFTEMLEGHDFVGGSETVKEMRREHKKRKSEQKSDDNLTGLVQKIKKRKH